MKDLIDALTIFSAYPRNPTVCSHDRLTIVGVGAVSSVDADRLAALGFVWDEDDECWFSFRFGSA